MTSFPNGVPATPMPETGAPEIILEARNITRRYPGNVALNKIYRTLRSLAQAGLSIVFTSSKVDETRALADRAFVLRQGSIAAEMTRDQITDEALFSAASPLLQPSDTPARHGDTP